MAARLLPAGQDPIRPEPGTPLTITIDDVPAHGLGGQSLAGVILASGTLAWRRTSAEGKPRGVFCGIGVCFDCIADVNGQRDVRTCLRRAAHGDVVVTQHDTLPEVAEHAAEHHAEQTEPSHQPDATELSEPSRPSEPSSQNASGDAEGRAHA